MPDERHRAKVLSRRAALLAGGEALLFGVLAARLYDLQVVEAKQYATLSDANRISIRWLIPPRGRIVDRFGVAIATNQPAYRATIIAEQTSDIPATLDALAALVSITEADRSRTLRDVRRKHPFIPVTILENLSWKEMAQIEVHVPELPGVSVEQVFRRAYPLGAATSHVTGFVAPVSETELAANDNPVLEIPDYRIGKSGIEKAYDRELRGAPGRAEVEVNAFGRVVRELSREDGVPGRDIALSLDLALQDLAARRCFEEKSAAAVVLDAWTGEVLALASSPGYDPNVFATGPTPAMWQELTTDPLRPLNDKAIAGSYAPGSTFKPIAALAALAAGTITPETHFFCPGYFTLGDAIFHCWKRSGHGSLAVREAIKHSCDVFFYNVAHLLGVDALAAMAKRFGLGTMLGIDIPGERPGLVPTKAWKLATTGIPWQQGETISAGIGQSYTTATPLQLAIQAARLVTGRAVVPRLRREGLMTKTDPAIGGGSTSPDFAPLGLSQRDLSLVLDGMNAVVNEPGGTAYGARIAVPGMEMGGKSGTSQVHHISEAEREHGVRKARDIPWGLRDHALFIAFAPVGAPRYVSTVVVEHGGKSGGGGSAVAAPICRDLLIEAQRRDPARRVPDGPVAEAGLRTVTDSR
jgi:penicillin-binding protein 2